MSKPESADPEITALLQQPLKQRQLQRLLKSQEERRLEVTGRGRTLE